MNELQQKLAEIQLGVLKLKHMQLSVEAQKFNPSHGPDGRFASGGGSGGPMMGPDTGGGSGGGLSSPSYSMEIDQVYEELLGRGFHEDSLDDMQSDLGDGYLRNLHASGRIDAEGIAFNNARIGDASQSPRTPTPDSASKPKPKPMPAADVPLADVQRWATQRWGSNYLNDATERELRFSYAEIVLGQQVN